MPSFRLDQEPWIPVELKDGHQLELSLTDVFVRASAIRRLTGNPLEVAVLMRLLLAIGHQVCNPTNDDEWITAWGDRDPIVAKMADYVRENAACFDLYDGNRPFAQHPKLEPGTKPLAVVEYDRVAGNNPVFIDGNSEADLVAVPSGLAARALLVNLAFGGSHPDKSSPLSTGKEVTMYAGPLCARLVAIVEGDSLAKTLILNLLVGGPAGQPSWKRPIPAGPGTSEVDGFADLYTRLTRFARLRPSPDGKAAESIALHMGDQVAGAEDAPSDPMIPLYLSKSDKKFKVLRLDIGKALWRSAAVLFCTKDSDSARPIKALQQLAPHVAFGAVPRTEQVGLRVLGVAGNAQGPKTFLWRDESLPFSLSLISDSGAFSGIVRAVEVAETHSRTLSKRIYGFALRYLKSAIPNPDPKDVSSLAEELAPELYDYWGAIGPRGEQLACKAIDELEWTNFVKKAADDAFRAAVDRLPPTARRFRAECARDADDSPKKEKAKKEKASV